MNDAAEQRASRLPSSLTGQLIAYIGNKRRLLPFLAPIFAEVAGRVPQRAGGDGAISFIDPMCGSGAVARLGRHLGFEVRANDWEEFAWTVTAPYLENTPEGLARLFRPHGGLRVVLARLNAVGHDPGVGTGGREGAPLRGYVATHFAPRETSRPRVGEERLFYTAENAGFIDRVRDAIDEWFPAGGPEEAQRGRRILVALLLYEASNHANTSGVFKAYHRGFGGHGRDALSRILAPMELEMPVMPDGPVGEAFCQDAGQFVAARGADICYLDPPYNSHQYGSNYFMLNTIARWDKPEVDGARDGEGNLRVKAGIRPDWTRTRSAFCSRTGAPQAMEELMDRIDAGVIVVSYSDSGVLSAEFMADLLSSRGALQLKGLDYTAYRGGRQSITRATSGRELVFVLDTRRRRTTPAASTSAEASARGAGDPAPGGPASGDLIRRQLLEWEVTSALKDRFAPERLRAQFTCDSRGIQLAAGARVETDDFYRLDQRCRLSDLDLATLESVARRLRAARCTDHAEEFEVLLGFMRSDEGRRRADYQRRLLTCLRKFAHRKYREQYRVSVHNLRELVHSHPDDLKRVADGLDSIVAQAELRFGG